MKRTKWLFAGIAAFMSVFGGGSPSNGQQPAIDLPVNQTTSYKGEEFLLIGDAVRGAGEPVIAINPKNPNNIIVGAYGQPALRGRRPTGRPASNASPWRPG